MFNKTHDITLIRRYQNTKGTDVWELTASNTDRLFVTNYKNQLGAGDWFSSGWGQYLFDMPEETRDISKSPMAVRAIPDGEFLSIVGVAPMPAYIETTVFDPEPIRELFHTWIYQTLSMLMASPNIAIFDTESTGTYTATDEIVSIAALNDKMSLLTPDTIYINPANPQKLLQPGRDGKSAYDVNGIHPDDLKDKPPFEVVYPLLYKALAEKDWVIWNADFDATLLDSLCIRHNKPIIPRLSVTCAMKLISPLVSEFDQSRNQFKWAKLEDTAKHYGIDTSGAHDAYADCVMTREILKCVWGEMSQ